MSIDSDTTTDATTETTTDITTDSVPDTPVDAAGTNADTDPDTPATPTPGDGTPDPEKIAAFAGQLFDVLTGASTALMTSIGHRAGLFDAMAGSPPSTSAQLAATASRHERYVREWLGAMTTAGIVVYDPGEDTYRLPPEHAAVLTRAAGPDNLASMMQFIPLLAQAEDEVLSCFENGGGVGYKAYESFHRVMAELSAGVNDAALLERTIPLIPGLPDRLAAGLRVADIGCGQGHAVNLMARAFPNSEFVGYDFSEAALSVAREEAADWGLVNARFELRDVADLSGTGSFGLALAFDAIHDQAHPAAVLAQIAGHLDPEDGVLLMIDMNASSHLEKNLDIPWATYLYTVSTMHCMTVSLSLGGDGLGTAWGVETAQRMLGEAGFTDVRIESVAEDFINAYYVARR